MAHDLDALKARGGPFVDAVEATRMPMLVTDAQAPGSPIIYTNHAFLRMLGREPGEVIGRGYVSIAGEHAAPETRGALEVAMQRLLRIGEVHGLLTYRVTYRGEAPDAVDFPAYLRRLCRQMAEGLVVEPGRVRVEVEAEEEATWGPDLVIPLGLIAGEALTNALKHAFPEGRGGRVRMVLRAQGGGLMRLCIEDDGIGMPAERRQGSLGLRLIEMFARQIRGRAEMEARTGGEGTVVSVTFPDPNHSPG